MTLSLCIVARNEEKHLEKLLCQILSQSFDKAKTELILIDSMSEDNTGEIFKKFSEIHKKDYLHIKILENPQKTQAAGWNLAISEAMGDCILRLDAHAEIPEDFLEKNIACIESGEFVCGGARPNIAENNSQWQELLLTAESSMFGSSFAGYRRQNYRKKYVSSVFHGCYRREVFEKTGGFNEALGRTEDNELHYRIRKNGFQICQSSEILSYQLIRPDLKSMLAQKYGNGKWVALTMGVCPQCISVFHFVPFCFLLAIIISLLSWLIFDFSFFLFLLLIFYGSADILMSIASVVTSAKRNPTYFLLPILFFLLHISYGWGSFIGFLQLPFWLKIYQKQSPSQRAEQVKEMVKKHSEN